MMGKVIMSGIVPQLTKPEGNLVAANIAVGSSVYLMEGETAVEYLVVNQGKPSGSSLYDDSCDGTWLLRKAIHSLHVWHNATAYSDYATTRIHSDLNGTIFDSFGDVERSVIKSVKIPYVKNGAVISGASGLSCNVFLLSGYEVGATDVSFFKAEGAPLTYFADNDVSKRIAEPFSSEYRWWLRSPGSGNNASIVTYAGGVQANAPNPNLGVRPAIILPRTALFDKESLILKGVA